MSALQIPAAAAPVLATLHTWLASKSAFGGILIVFGCLLVVTLGVFIWAAFFRKSSPRRPHHHHWKTRRPGATDNSGAERPRRSHLRFWRRHKRRHRKHPAKPTLAETGGLPSVRDSGSEPPASL